MGRPAARDLDEHVCPQLAPPGPHGGGQVLVAKPRTVLVGGKPAAVLVDPVTCAGWDNLIAMGSTTVVIEGFWAARKYDLTTHGGMILQGEPTVRLGTDTPADLLALGIARIRNSDYGKTKEGQEMIALLEKKLADGSLRPGELPPDVGGFHDKGIITINDDNLDDVDGVAQAMVHEGKHAQGKMELEAHEEENKLYREQRHQGYLNPGDEELGNAINADSLEPDQLERDKKLALRELLEKRKYPSGKM
jgi:uncharacterized Zn-binding protein involved in type VI secretion